MALLTICRAAKHNAISLATLEELHDAVGQAATDDAVRVITITGEGERAFASGSDLGEVLHRDFKKALEPIVQGLADRLERPAQADHRRHQRHLHGRRPRGRLGLRPAHRHPQRQVRHP